MLSPLIQSGSPLHSDPVLKKIAEKHNASTSAVLISWAVARGTVVLPKSVTPSRISSNKEILNLDQEDIAGLDALAAQGKQQRINSPPWGTDHGFPNWYGPGNKDAPEGARLLAGKA